MAVPQLKKVLLLHSPSMVFLCKTKNQEKYMKEIQRKIKCDKSYIVNPKGKAGGLALF